MGKRTIGLTAVGVLCLYTVTASAAGDPALTCTAGKLNESSKYSACLLKTQAKAVLKGLSADFSKCVAKFNAKFPATEIKAGPGICPSEGDVGPIGQRILWNADALAIALSGGAPTDPYCPGSGQTTSYGTGDDGDIQPGAPLGYADNGDGTITDLNTGLVWEKKVGGVSGGQSCTSETGNCANPHHAANTYRWTDGVSLATTYDGTVVTFFLEQLNNRCDNDTTILCSVDTDCTVPGGACGFAGHRDWRLPSQKELQGIVDFSMSNPAGSPAFHGASCGGGCLDLANPACSCTQSYAYWSSTWVPDFPSWAWYVWFYGGDASQTGKTTYNFVRAVRAGS